MRSICKKFGHVKEDCRLRKMEKLQWKVKNKQGTVSMNSVISNQVTDKGGSSTTLQDDIGLVVSTALQVDNGQDVSIPMNLRSNT